MAQISVDFRNIVSKKCAVSSPRIVNLEIGNESPGSASESAFKGFFHSDQVSPSDCKDNSNLICGCDKQIDNNFALHSQSYLSTSTCDERPTDKIKSSNDIDIDLLDLLNSAKTDEAVERGVENFNSKKNTSDDKMRVISDTSASDGFSDLLLTIVHEISETEGKNGTYEYCQDGNTQDSGIDLLDFDFAKNECSNSLPSNNSSLKVEGNLSELLSSLNIEDSDVTKVRSSNSISMPQSKLEMKRKPCVPDFSDLLSAANLGSSANSKTGSSNQGNVCSMKIVGNKEESCLADLLLSSVDTEKSNNSTIAKETSVTDLSDILSSLDLGDSNDSKVSSQDNVYNTKIVERKDESCLADLLFVDGDKSASTLLNNRPSSFGSSNLLSKGNKDVSDSINDFTFDVLSFCSSNNSCASSYSETENNSPNDALTKNHLNTFESDSAYNSFDSAHKEFSFFDYSSDNQFSFNTLLTEKSDANIAIKPCGFNDARNKDEEISMSDLLNIVSPELKNPVLATLNKVEKCKSDANNDSLSMVNLIESLNIESTNSYPNVITNNSIQCNEELPSFDCIDGRIAKEVQNNMKTTNFQEERDIFADESDDGKITSDDEQITCIDLRECIKTPKLQFTETSPIKQVKSVEEQGLECFSPNKILFYCETDSPSDLSQTKPNSFEFNDTVPRMKSRINTKQTLFSKALACKPKKDQSLLQKVANIKNELLNSIINRPIFIDCDVPKPKIESVIQSDKCILSNMGLRSFGLNMPCELQ